MVKHLPTMQETRAQSLGWEDPLEKEMAIHSSILAWKIPWMEEPGRLQSMGSQRVGHDWATFFLSLKLKTYSQIKSPLHFYGTSGLLPLINLFLSHLLTSANRTLPPCRQRHSTPLIIIKILLKPLAGPDNLLLCHCFCYYLKWVYDNEMFSIGDILSCSYERVAE